MKKIISLILSIVIAVTCVSVNAVSAFAADYKSVSGDLNYEYAFSVLELVNQERNKEGLSSLVMDKQLLDSAMMRSTEIAVQFDHTRPNGKSLSSLVDCNCMYGENIAMGYRNAKEVVNGWMNSQGHKENILRMEYKNIGVGCFYCEGTYYWVQIFTGDSISADRICDTYNVKTQYVDSDVSLNPDCETRIHLSAKPTTTKSTTTTTTTTKPSTAKSNTTKSTTTKKNSTQKSTTKKTTAKNKTTNANESYSGKLNDIVAKSLKTSIVKLKSVKRGVEVKWKKISGVSGYQIQLTTDSHFKKNIKTVNVNGASKTSKKITGLKANKKYYVRVRAYKTNNGKKYYSTWSKSKQISVRK